MSTIRQMLPQVAQPFTEAIVGAGLGALLSRFVLRRDMTTGAIVGGVAGYGVALTKAKGAFPFAASGAEHAGGTNTYYLGQGAEVVEEVVQQPQPEIIPEYVPEWRRPWRRDDWWRRGGGGYGGWGAGHGYGGWGHGWRR